MLRIQEKDNGLGQGPREQEGQGVCVGNEVEILTLEIGSEPGPEVSSAMTIAKNNGSIQEGDQRFKKRIPRAMCDFSQLLPVVQSVTGRQVNGEVRGLDRRPGRWEYGPQDSPSCAPKSPPGKSPHQQEVLSRVQRGSPDAQ